VVNQELKMNTLIVFEMFESRVFASLPQEVYAKYKKKLNKCHMHFDNTVGCPKEVNWLAAALATEYLDSWKEQHKDAGCLGQYVLSQEEGKPFEATFERVIYTGCVP
jgi:hypothetical protein